MSAWSEFVDDCFTDLVTNVPGLRDVLEHRYSPSDPEELTAEQGEHHLSIFPVADSAQAATPLVTAPGGDQLTEVYRILYWEHAGDVSARGIEDQRAWKDLLDLAEDVRDRFYKIANIGTSTAFGGSSLVRYIGAAFPDRSGQVRWFAIGVTATREITAT